MKEKYNKIKNKMPLLYVLIMVFLLMLVTSFSANSKISIDSANIPIGGIIIWTGHAFNDFDSWGNMINNSDWHLCNGVNGTTNLEGKFICGFDPEDNEIDTIGYTSGNSSYTLTIDQMPEHQHIFFDNYRNVRGGNILNGIVQYANDKLGGIQSITNAEGGSEPFDNRPDFYIVAYIQRVS